MILEFSRNFNQVQLFPSPLPLPPNLFTREMETSEPRVDDIHTEFGDKPSDFQHLVDYGDVRYHLLLQFNEVEDACAENTALNELYDAFSRNDQVGVHNAVNTCLELIWPFMLGDYKSRNGSESAEVIKLQVLTIGGVLQQQSHDNQFDREPPGPIDNTFPGITTYMYSDVEKLDEISADIYKVKVHDSIYCMKTVYRTGREADFVREISTLLQCCHPNIIKLIGIVQAEGSDKIDGMLMDYIENARVLGHVDSVSSDEYDKWTGQISGAIKYLHEKELVWGDAKATNILVCEDGNTVLIDFGGGYTDGWVDESNCNTPRGDLQGLEAIMLFIREKVEAVNVGPAL